MHEFGISVPLTGLAKHSRDLAGMTELRNLAPGYRFLYVPELPGECVGGLSDRLLLGREGILSVTLNSDDSHTITDGHNVTVTIPDSHNTNYHMADFGAVVVLANSERTIVISMDTGEYMTSDPVEPPDVAIRHFDSICAHHDTRFLYAQGSTVGWSAILGDDLMALLTGDNIPPAILARNQTNTTELPFPGKVLAMIPLRSFVVVYGEQGIVALSTSHGNYGLYTISDLPDGTGCAGRGAAASDGSRHLFADKNGTFWNIFQDRDVLRAQRIDTVRKPDPDPILTYDSKYNHWWASSRHTGQSLCLTPEGVGGPIGAVVMSSDNNGRYTGQGYDSLCDIPVVVRTNMIDNGSVEQTRVTWIRTGAERIRNLAATIDMRTYTGRGVQTFPLVRANREGASFVNKAVTQYYIRVAGSARPGARINSIETRAQSHDRRTRRGGKAGAPYGGGDDES